MRGAIEGVIAAEEAACEQYLKIIRATQDFDPVTADLCTRLLADEEEHLALFRGFLTEYVDEEPETPSTLRLHEKGSLPTESDAASSVG